MRLSDELIEERGLPLGSEALQVAAHRGPHEAHLSFAGRATFLVFGDDACPPCTELVEVAAQHPATAYMRLVYVSESGAVDTEPEVAGRWEMYRFDNKAAARQQWNTPVSPYFHAIDEDGVIVAKGVANLPGHLDRLLALRPAVLARAMTLGDLATERRTLERPR